MARLDGILLAGVGVLLTHQGAYTLAAMTGEQASIAHGHMQIAWLLASLALLGGLTRSVLRSLQRRTTTPVSELRLFTWIALGYSGLEIGERIVDGYGALSLFHEPVYWIGLALAPLVAIALGWSLRSVERAIVAITIAVTEALTAPVVPAPCATLFAYPSVNSLGQLMVLAAPRRGPPFVS